MTQVMPLRASVCAAAFSLWFCVFAFNLNTHCQINSEFKAEIRRHFPKFSRLAPEFSNLAKVKIAQFFRQKNTRFCN